LLFLVLDLVHGVCAVLTPRPFSFGSRYQETTGTTQCVPCLAGSVCAEEGTADPVACATTDGSAEYCPVGSTLAELCPLGHFCSGAVSKVKCSAANAEYCPEGSAKGKSCPANSVCSLAVQCADGSAPDLWYNDPIASSESGGTGADLSNLPDLAVKASSKSALDGTGVEQHRLHRFRRCLHCHQCEWYCNTILRLQVFFLANCLVFVQAIAFAYWLLAPYGCAS
jgi:hypothetical protein